MSYRICVTARALEDADEAYAWIAEHISLLQAERWYQGLFRKIDTLTRFPTRCPCAAESVNFPEELRELLYGTRKNKHRILFTIRDNDVVLLYIHHSVRGELKR